MKTERRFFIKTMSALTAGISVSSNLPAGKSRTEEYQYFLKRDYSYDDNRIVFFLKEVHTPIKVIMIADTHLSLNDDRENPYRIYSERMAQYYHKTTHFKTGQATNPVESFEKVLAIARDSKADLLALVGDIFSFPSEAAIEWVYNQLESSGIPYCYVAGNHDWHYEGMEGSAMQLREQWIQKRLLPLYQKKNPFMYSIEVKGIRFVVLDNSTYEILPEQLVFFREQVRANKPMVLLVHIPLYAPGRDVGYGCGHPQWNWDTDRHYSWAKLPRWPKSGHTETTMAFHREVFAASNLIGIFAGHIHRQTMDSLNGIPQFLTKPNAEGAFLDIDFLQYP